MALLTHSIKNWLFLAALTGILATPLTAADFSVQRGISLDIWTDWPDESRWNDAEVLLPFPQWRQHLGPDDLVALHSAGFDFVRIPVDVSVFLSANTGKLRAELYASVLESVQIVNRAGLKALVDMHLIPAGSNRQIGMMEVMREESLFTDYLDVLRTMAQTLSNQDPAQVALELMNEPVANCKDGVSLSWPKLLSRLYAAARSSATRLTLVLSGGCWSSAQSLIALDPGMIPDENTLWTFHSYAPFVLTHQGAGWAGDFIVHVHGIPYPPFSVPPEEQQAILDRIRENIRGSAPLIRRHGLLSYLDELYAEVSTRQALSAIMNEPFERVASWATRNNIDASRILLGEFGMIRQEYGSDHVLAKEWRAAYVNDMIAAARRHGFAWSLWSYGGAFGMVEEFSQRTLPEPILPLIHELHVPATVGNR